MKKFFSQTHWTVKQIGLVVGIAVLLLAGLITGIVFLNKFLREKRDAKELAQAEEAKRQEEEAKKQADAAKAKRLAEGIIEEEGPKKVYVTVPAQRIEVQGIDAPTSDPKPPPPPSYGKPSRSKIEELAPFLALLTALLPLLIYILRRVVVMGKELTDVIRVIGVSFSDGVLTKEELQNISKETKEFLGSVKETIAGVKDQKIGEAISAVKKVI